MTIKCTLSALLTLVFVSQIYSNPTGRVYVPNRDEIQLVAGEHNQGYAHHHKERPLFVVVDSERNNTQRAASALRAVVIQAACVAIGSMNGHPYQGTAAGVAANVLIGEIADKERDFLAQGAGIALGYFIGSLIAGLKPRDS